MERDTPITRIELLSPANKFGGSHAAIYLMNRQRTLEAGINMVELDYLHETRSPIQAIPDYTKRESESFSVYDFGKYCFLMVLTQILGFMSMTRFHWLTFR